MQLRRLALVLLLLFIATSVGAEPLHFSKAGPRNFGVLVHNEKHTIYRSARLGKSGLKDLAGFLKERGLPFPQKIIHMNVDGYKHTMLYPEAFALEEFKESARLGFKFYHSFDHQFSTYLSGRDPYEVHRNIYKEEHLDAEALKAFGFNSSIVIDGGMEAFYRILDLVLESDGPVLFHCTGGHHRTGNIAMAIRYLQGGDWLKATRVNKSHAPVAIKNDAQYEYFLHNKNLPRWENLAFIEKWSKDPKFKDYQNRYQASLNLPSKMDWTDWGSEEDI